MSMNAIAGSYGSCMFSFVRNCKTTFHNHIPHLTPPPSNREKPSFSHPCWLLY